MWHVMEFKLSIQSPGSRHLSKPYGVTFYCNSEMRWLERHTHIRKEPHFPFLYPPPAKSQRVLRAFVFSHLFLLPCFLSVSFCFPWSSHPLTIYFTSLSPHYQPKYRILTLFSFVLLFPQNTICKSHLCLESFLLTNSVVEWGRVRL